MKKRQRVEEGIIARQKATAEEVFALQQMLQDRNAHLAERDARLLELAAEKDTEKLAHR